MAMWRKKKKVHIHKPMPQQLNVRGTSLQPCSHPGMPLTGYSRDGYCKTNSGDRGSHNVCVKDLGRGFCEVTGQNDWCGAVDNWCVCELAFDEAVRKLGCDAFTVECDSTNGVVGRLPKGNNICH